MQDKLTQMAVVDRFIHIRILGLSHWFAPAKKQELYDWPSLKEFRRELIDNRIEFLELTSFIKTTANYCLPRNRPLCAAAAKMMMREILTELEIG